MHRDSYKNTRTSNVCNVHLNHVIGVKQHVRTHLYRPTTSADKMLIPVGNVKHPLQNEWSFWMFTNREKNWKANLVELTSFDTVEDYWCLYHHMKVPSELRLGQDYLVFKKGIKPMWEDEANKYGGRLLIMLDGVHAVYMDSIWSDAVLLLIGETFEHADEITGVVVNVRDKNKICSLRPCWLAHQDGRDIVAQVATLLPWIQNMVMKDYKKTKCYPIHFDREAVWMRSAKRKAVVEIGKKLRALFRIPCRIHFYKHNSSASLYSF